MACAVWANKVVGEVKLAQSRVLLDGFADGYTASHHCLVICEVEHKQVAFVTEDTSNRKGSFLANAAIRKV